MSKDQRVMTILVLGETGKGKSAFASAYLGETNLFPSAASGEGVTDVTSCKSKKVDGIYRCVIDTPGFSDPKGRDTVHIEDMVTYLKNYENGILVIALVVQVYDYRVTQDLQKVLQQLKIMFNNPEIWSHFCIVVTHCSPGNELNRSEKETLFRPKVAEVIRRVDSRCIPNLQIPVFFVNSTSFQTDASTKAEIKRFHDFAAGMQKPVSTNQLSIPDEVFARIEKSTINRKVSEQSISIPYQTVEEYQEQEPYYQTVYYSAQEPYTKQEHYTIQVPYTEEVPVRYTSLFFHHTKYVEVTKYKEETRTRPVTEYRSVQRSRQELRYRPISKTRDVTKIRNGVREFWETVETTKKTFYNGKTDVSTKTLYSWTKDV